MPATLCGNQNFFDDRSALQLAAREYLHHVVGNILLGAAKKCCNSLLAGPDSFVYRVNHRFHLHQAVFRLIDDYVVSLPAEALKNESEMQDFVLLCVL